jgi:hypothetical protein
MENDSTAMSKAMATATPTATGTTTGTAKKLDAEGVTAGGWRERREGRL